MNFTCFYFHISHFSRNSLRFLSFMFSIILRQNRAVFNSRGHQMIGLKLDSLRTHEKFSFSCYYYKSTLESPHTIVHDYCRNKISRNGNVATKLRNSKNWDELVMKSFVLIILMKPSVILTHFYNGIMVVDVQI